MSDLVQCMICSKELKAINALHLRCHGITTQEYIERFPDAKLSSEGMLANRSKALTGKPRSEAVKKQLSKSIKESWKKNPNQGRTGCPLSEESRKKLSEKMMGHEVSDETRKKIGISGLGREPWNKGLTKEDDERIKSVSKKVSKWNREFMTDEKKQQISQTLKQRYADGMKVPAAKNGYRKDLDMTFRSTWEANYARALLLKGEKIIYEKERFVFDADDGSINLVYTPDFKIADNHFIEVKGHAESIDIWSCSCSRCQRDKLKLHLMGLHYPDIKVDIFGKKEYKALVKKYRGHIDNWEVTNRG